MLFVLPTVPGTLADRDRLRPIGRNNERYQQMLNELRKIAILADDAGFDVMTTTEHHFHSEGYEASVAPLLLYADLAPRTKRIKFSPPGWCYPLGIRCVPRKSWRFSTTSRRAEFSPDSRAVIKIAGLTSWGSNIMPPAHPWTARR